MDRLYRLLTNAAEAAEVARYYGTRDGPELELARREALRARDELSVAIELLGTMLDAGEGEGG